MISLLLNLCNCTDWVVGFIIKGLNTGFSNKRGPQRLRKNELLDWITLDSSGTLKRRSGKRCLQSSRRYVKKIVETLSAQTTQIESYLTHNFRSQMLL